MSGSQITRQLADAGHAGGAEEVRAAWSAVLAGDVDDLAAHLDLERRHGPA